MKRMITIGLLLMTLLSLAACGSDSMEDGKIDQSSDDKVTSMVSSVVSKSGSMTDSLVSKSESITQSVTSKAGSAVSSMMELPEDVMEDN